MSENLSMLQNLIESWFTSQGWTPLPFQKAAWKAFAIGESGLIHVPTGAGKTYAAYFGPLLQMIENPPEGLTFLYVTPLRAVARDIEKALRRPLDDLKLKFRLEIRNGDTSAYVRERQKTKVPHILVTTPESLSLLLSYPDAKERFKNLRSVVVDEWHELLATKRGTQMELALARLRMWSPKLQTWALSATLPNLDEAAQTLVGLNRPFQIVSQKTTRSVEVSVLLPDKVEVFPWAGHMGLAMVPKLLEKLNVNESTLIFTNTRSQAEKWIQILSDAKPEWQSVMAVHHGSIDRKERERVESGLKEGTLKIVVTTSSLDLGVDFSPVTSVFQIGSPKGVGRLIQRAGRSAHRPDRPCNITLVPTNSLELIEIAAAQKALEQNLVEPRFALHGCLDVLAQHFVTCALAGGFRAEELKAEIKTTLAFSDISDSDFNWTLEMVTSGGYALQAYPQYHKIQAVNDLYVVENNQTRRWHRMNIGTITSDSSISVCFMKGKSLGSVEESFISKLRKNDRFVFAGRTLEFIRLQNNKAFVRKSKLKPNMTPRWLGGRLPFSPSLAAQLRKELELAQHEIFDSPAMQSVRPVLAKQKLISRIPDADEILVETLKTREGYHLFLFPFEGRMIHEGIASVLALRLSRASAGTYSLTVNDYGIELLSSSEIPFSEEMKTELFSTDYLVRDIMESLNLTELSRRQFREIARVAGLVFQNQPGTPKTVRQVQVSASLLYDVFKKYEPGNLLVRQAQDEVLFRQFEETRLAKTMNRIATSKFCLSHPKTPSPLAFPLIVERFGAAVLSNETLAQRVEKMKAQWSKATLN